MLLGGVAIGLTRSPIRQYKILTEIKDDWQWLNEQSGKRAFDVLKRNKLVAERTQAGGRKQIVLTPQGKNEALTLNLEEITIPQKRKLLWDGRWRIVAFDIPERRRRYRTIFRYHLQRLGFIELQKSLFIYPYKCFNEVQQIVDDLFLKKYVRLIIADSIDQESKYLKTFKLYRN